MNGLTYAPFFPKRRPPLLAAFVLLLAGLSAAPVVAQEVPALSLGRQAGVASFLDHRGVLDRVKVRVGGLEPAPDGRTYLVWLKSQDDRLAQLVGELVPDEQGAAALDWEQPAGETLLGPYSQVVVTLEDRMLASTQPAGQVVLLGEIDRGVLVQARRLLFRWPDSRYGIASLQGLRRLVSLVALQTWILQQDVDAGNLAGARRKAEHLVNLIEGQGGAYFGDHNGDRQLEDPGDGVGVLGYAHGAQDQAHIAWAQAEHDELAATALELESSLQYVLDWSGLIRDVGLELALSDDPDRARELAEALTVAARQVEAGVDTRGDEELAALIDGGGLRPAYQVALELVSMELKAPE